MGLSRTLSFHWNPIGFVSNLVEKWDSSGCSSEKQCEESLYSFLHAQLPDMQIVQQYGRGRTHVDLMVGEKVMIELKYALSSTGEYQRLVGQLVDYKDWGKQFILVLAGETEPNLFKQLDKELQRQ